MAETNVVLTPSAQEALERTVTPLRQYLATASPSQVENLIATSLSRYAANDFYTNYLKSPRGGRQQRPLQTAFLSYLIQEVLTYADYLARNPFGLIDTTLEYADEADQVNISSMTTVFIDDYIIYRSFNPYQNLFVSGLLTTRPIFYYHTKLTDRRYVAVSAVNSDQIPRNIKAALLQYLFANYTTLMARTWPALTNLAVSVGLAVPVEFRLQPGDSGHPGHPGDTNGPDLKEVYHNLVLAILEALLAKLYTAVRQFQSQASRNITFLELLEVIKAVIAPSRGQ